MAADLWALTIGTTRPSSDGVKVKILAALMLLSIAGNRRLIQRIECARQNNVAYTACIMECTVHFDRAWMRTRYAYFKCERRESLYTCSAQALCLCSWWCGHRGGGVVACAPK